MTKKEKMRELLCAGLNELIITNSVNITDYNEDGENGAIYTEVLRKKSMISWRYKNFGEIGITIWWGLKVKCKESTTTLPFNKNLKDAFDVCCSGWLERKDGIWLQGHGKQGLYDTFCAKDAEKDLFTISDVKPLGYKKEGPYIN